MKPAILLKAKGNSDAGHFVANLLMAGQEAGRRNAVETNCPSTRFDNYHRIQLNRSSRDNDTVTLIYLKDFRSTETRK